MKKLKLRALASGATEVLTRSQMKNVLGGSMDPPGDCGQPTDPNGCSTADCARDIGTCKNVPGTCGSSNHNTKCTCAIIADPGCNA